MMKIELIDIVIIGVGHNKGKSFPGQLEFQIKKPEQGIAGQLKPDCGHGIVDMAQHIHIPKAGRHGYGKHILQYRQNPRKMQMPKSASNDGADFIRKNQAAGSLCPASSTA
jgi:hypothetical protein